VVCWGFGGQLLSCCSMCRLSRVLGSSVSHTPASPTPTHPPTTRATGRVWDCRTGRSVQVLEGHVKQILCIDFSPNGYQIATGSDDHSARIWDLRKKGCVYCIPAHRSLVSAVRWQPGDGHYLLTASYDAAVKVGARAPGVWGGWVGGRVLIQRRRLLTAWVPAARAGRVIAVLLLKRPSSPQHKHPHPSDLVHP